MKFNREVIAGAIRINEHGRFVILIDANIQHGPIRKYDKFDICFVVNPIPYRAQHLALQFFKSHKLFDLLINNPIYNDYIQINYQIEKDDRFENFDLNDEQRSAVAHILNKTDNLPPYILYGPAGTGKTKTVVAAIVNIVRKTQDNVLVCVQTNLACDEITSRLIHHLKKDEMLRLYAKTYPVQKVDKKLRAFSNIYEIDSKYFFEFPRLSCIYSYRVVICTLCTSSCLARATKEKKWTANHFKYVFIDENACTAEILSLVAIAGKRIFIVFIIFR